MQTQSDASKKLLAATIFWLRQLNTSGLSYSRILRELEVFANVLYFPTGVPELPKDYVISSAGEVVFAPCVPNEMRFLWASRPSCAQLMLPSMEYIKVSNKIDVAWIEWALGTAMFSLHQAGIKWQVPPAKQTIGGLEVADFLDL